MGQKTKRHVINLASIKEGMVARVFYDPESPSDAVLEPGIHSDVLFGLFVGVIFSMFGFGVLWIDNRNIKNDI